MDKCNKCNKEFKSIKGVYGHQVVHTLGWAEKNCRRIVDYSKRAKGYVGSPVSCSICGKVYSSKGLATHIWRSHSEGVNHDPNIGFKHCSKTRVAWNKGLTKASDDRVARNAESVSRTLQGKAQAGLLHRKLSDKEKRGISLRQSEHNNGGKAKWFEVNGLKVQGTWEVKVATLMNKEGIEWARPKPMKYLYKGRERNYTPDFYLIVQEIYLEVKGHWWGDDKQKMIAFHNSNSGVDIRIIDKHWFSKLMNGELTIVDFIRSGNSSVECLAED